MSDSPYSIDWAALTHEQLLQLSYEARNECEKRKNDYNKVWQPAEPVARKGRGKGDVDE